MSLRPGVVSAPAPWFFRHLHMLLQLLNISATTPPEAKCRRPCLSLAALQTWRAALSVRRHTMPSCQPFLSNPLLKASCVARIVDCLLVSYGSQTQSETL